MMMPRKTRVLHIITRLILGGAQENTLLTVIGQHRSGRYDVVLLSGIDDGPEGNLHEMARAAGVQLVLVPWLIRPIRPLFDACALVKLHRFIKNGNFEVVHTHSSKAGILGRIAAWLAGVPVIVHTLHSLVFHQYQSRLKNRFYIALKKLCAPMTDCYISVCDAVTAGALQHGIGSPERYATVYSGIPLGPFVDAARQLTSQAARVRLGLDPAVPVVGKVARLYHQKGHDLFLRSAALLAKRHPRITFLVVGDGILRDNLRDIAQRLGIADRVVFAGRVDPAEVPIYMRAMDVLVHTSIREGVARVIPQAYAACVPVVALNLDGAPEVIEHGRTGYLIEPDDDGGIADAVSTLLESEPLRRDMARKGQEIVMKKFPVEVMVDQIDRIYQRLLEGNGTQGRSHAMVAKLNERGLA